MSFLRTKNRYDVIMMTPSTFLAKKTTNNLVGRHLLMQNVLNKQTAQNVLFNYTTALNMLTLEQIAG